MSCSNRYRFKFNEYVSSLCREVDRKLSTICINNIINLINFQQKGTLRKSISEAKFGYCSLIWLFYGRELRRKSTHILKGNNGSFNDLLFAAKSLMAQTASIFKEIKLTRKKQKKSM